MTSRRTITALALFALIAAGPVMAEEVGDLEKSLKSKWMKYKSMTADMKLEGTMPQGAGKMEGTGTIEYLRQGDKPLSRVEMKNTVSYGAGDQAMKMEQNMTMIVDGEYAYTIMDGMGQKMAMKMDIDPKMTSDPGLMFSELRKEHDLAIKPDEEVSGRATHVVEATAKEGTSPQFTKIVVYFDKETGFLLKNVSQDATGEMTQTMTYSNIKIDPKIDPARFVFKAPEGVTVLDQTTK